MINKHDLASRSRLRSALAWNAYEADKIRLAGTDLTNADVLIGSRQGLFIASKSGAQLLGHGRFFGVTEYDNTIYIFESCDTPSRSTRLGRILALKRKGNEIVDARVVTKGLDNGCHQVAVIDSHICVVDTHNQGINRFTMTGDYIDTMHPLPPLLPGDKTPSYVHMNGITAVDDRIYVMAHNGTITPRKASEVIVLDKDWKFIKRYFIDGHGCHNTVALPGGRLLHCGSEAGELISSDGLKCKISESMTRGLAFNRKSIIVGASLFAERAQREDITGSIIYLDHSYNIQAEVVLSAAPNDLICL